MSILAGFLAALTGFIRGRRHFRLETDLISDTTHSERRKTKSIVKSGLILLLCALAFHACAHTAQHQAESKATDVSLYEGIISFYSGPLNHLRAVRHGECPMHPSCSEYSGQAIARFGFVKGWIMTMDRLIRCGRDEIHTASRIWVNGKWKYYDPVEDNDLWHEQQTS